MGVFIWQPALADVLVSQTTKNTATNTALGFAQQLGQGSTIGSGFIGKITVNGKRNAPAPATLIVQAFSNANYDVLVKEYFIRNTTCSGSTNGTLTFSTSFADVTYDLLNLPNPFVLCDGVTVLTTGIPIDSNLFYSFTIQRDGTIGAPDDLTLQGSSTNSYPNGECTPSFRCGSVQDLYFIIEAATSTTSVFSPTNGSSQADFSNWIIETNILTNEEVAGNWRIDVEYTASSHFENLDSVTYDPPSGLHQRTIPKNLPLSPDTYNVRAKLFNPSNTLIATSSTNSFTITSGATTTYPQPVGEGAVTVTCDPNSGFFENSLCKMFQAVFKPKQESLDRFGTLGDQIAGKPPFGWFNAIATIISGLVVGTPSVTVTGVTELGSFFTPLSTGISFVLYFLLGLWFFHRFRNFEL